MPEQCLEEGRGVSCRSRKALGGERLAPSCYVPDCFEMGALTSPLQGSVCGSGASTEGCRDFPLHLIFPGWNVQPESDSLFPSDHPNPELKAPLSGPSPSVTLPHENESVVQDRWFGEATFNLETGSLENLFRVPPEVTSWEV